MHCLTFFSRKDNGAKLFWLTTGKSWYAFVTKLFFLQLRRRPQPWYMSVPGGPFFYTTETGDRAQDEENSVAFTLVLTILSVCIHSDGSLENVKIHFQHYTTMQISSIA